MFEEVRNLCLGVAARGINWNGLSATGQTAIWATVLRKLFSNLFARSKYIAESLTARGHSAATPQRLNIPILLPSSTAANAVSIALLLTCQVWVLWRHYVPAT